MMRAYIGLGSNLQNPKQQIKTAIADIKTIPATIIQASSSLYQSPPMGPADQPDFLNAVVVVETALTAYQLLDALQAIEQKHGRIRKRHWGERTLDLDILLYGDEVIEDERLIVPHQGLADRAFVIYPLAEVAADLNIPGLGALTAVKAQCPLNGLHKVGAV